MLTDHRTQFYVNKRNEKGEGENKFGAYLKENNIKHIVSRVNHPQTNGKLEKWFDLYDKRGMILKRLKNLCAGIIGRDIIRAWIQSINCKHQKKHSGLECQKNVS